MNPFDIIEPISDKRFCNREEAIEFIEKYTLSPTSAGNVWITSERQIGKTSLLHKLYIKYKAEQKVIKRYGTELKISFVYVNVQDCITQDNFFMYLYIKLKETFDFKIKIGKDNRLNFIQAMEYIYEKTKTFIVFLIDEFDACLRLIAESNQVQAKQLINTINRISEGEISTDGLVRKSTFVFASNHSLSDLADIGIIPYGSFTVQEYELKWFTLKHIETLVANYLENRDLKFTRKEIELCYEATRGYPRFTQKLLAIMYEQKPLFDNEKEFRKAIAGKFANDIEQTIKSWGGDSMPKRTMNGLRTMLVELKLGENIGKVIGTILGEMAKKILT